jgi:hypothetical protein
VLRVTNAPAAMDVRLLLPDNLSFTQTDKYEPEPESTAGKWANTWHLTASTAAPAPRAQFLAVFLVHREGEQSRVPHVELLRGTGAVGVKLTARDGSHDVVAFRTDADAKKALCGGLESTGRVFAQGEDRKGRTTRRFTHP